MDHQAILEFIDAKRTPGVLTNFNLSVGLTDRFIEALERGESYDLHHPASGQVTRRLQARTVFDQLVQAAWETGDPGLLFLDTSNRANPTPTLGLIAATNPCGEVPLLPYESCNLGSINLAHFIKEGHGQEEVDWPRLGAVVQQAIRFLDDVLVVNRYPLPETEAITLANRKVGLGVMGFAELLIRLGILYQEEQALRCAQHLMGFLLAEARQSSARLGVERGVFPNWSRSRYEPQGERLRNATVTSIAPTGTLSIMAGTSSSIEPLFALCYRRVGVLEGQTFTEWNPCF